MGEQFLRKKCEQYRRQADRIAEHLRTHLDLFDLPLAIKSTTIWADLAPGVEGPDVGSDLWLVFDGEPGAAVYHGGDLLCRASGEATRDAERFAEGRTEVSAKVSARDAEIDGVEITLLRPTRLR